MCEYAGETLRKTVSRRPMVNLQSHTINISCVSVLLASHCKDKLVTVLWKDDAIHANKWTS